MVDKLKLQVPPGAECDRWDSLYQARGDQVNPNRPIFTGDILSLEDGLMAVLQHPCALRSNGVDLQPHILVGRVEGCRRLNAPQWAGNYKCMPLPSIPCSGHEDARISFTDLGVVGRKQVEAAERIASMSELGSNLLLQRWIHHNSRVIVPTHSIQEVTSGPFAETDLVEEWCDHFVDQGWPLDDCRIAAHEWLRQRDPEMNQTRQQMLEDVEQRSAVRRAMRRRLLVPMRDESSG